MGEPLMGYKRCSISSWWCRIVHGMIKKQWRPSRYWNNQLVCKLCGRKYYGKYERPYGDD